MRSLNSWLESDYRPIGGGALESNINGLWFMKQSAKGTPAVFTVGTKRARWVGGDLQTNRNDGSEAWSDQTLFADTVDFVNPRMGNGAPVLQGQSSLVAYLAWLSCGQETVTGGANAVITLTMTGAPTAGTFTLSWTILGNVYTTTGIASTATAAATLAAIQAALPAAYGGTNIVATGGPFPTTPVVLTFSGANTAARPIPLPTVVSSLTGGTTPTVAPTTTTAGTPFSHVATPTDTGGFFYGVVKSVGKSVVHRVQYNDCRTQSLRIEGSSASKVVKVTPTFISLDPGVIVAADPTKLDDGLRPLLYTEAAGAFTIDGSVYQGHSAFAAMFTWGLNEFYGDAVTVYDLINNEATAVLEGVTLLIDQAGLARFNSQIYGTTTPGVGARPITGLPLLGSYVTTFTRVDPNTGLTSESLKIEFFAVKWSPSLAIPANPGGGAVELSFAGAMRKSAGLPPFRITTANPLDAAFTA
jgi:hypothetical protein